MLTYYYDDPTALPDNLTVTTSANAVTHAVANMTNAVANVTNTMANMTNSVANVTNSVAKVANMTHVRQEQGGPLTRLDHSANPALVHHLYLGLGHMGKVSSGSATLGHGQACNPCWKSTSVMYSGFFQIIKVRKIHNYKIF